MAAVRVNLSRYLKLFGREIIFEVFQFVTDSQTDRRQTTYCGITALCVASREKLRLHTGQSVMTWRNDDLQGCLEKCRA